jgi:serine/threonine-protein kinase
MSTKLIITPERMYYEPGTIIGDRYKIIAALGSGGMATVYSAKSIENPDFQVALKIFYPGIIRSAEARDRFRTEILAAYRVPHENVIQVYEFFDQGDLFAFALELADGGDLYRRLQRGPLSQTETIDMMDQIAAGLSAIHEADIVHRDLKPENILLTRAGRAKISDFGVARLAGIQTPTQSGHIVGTPRYVSPEYVASGKCDLRCDIFALGIMAFEMLTRKAPFPDHQGEVLSSRRFDPSTRTYLKDCHIDYTEDLENIIERCLALTTERRYQRADQIRTDIALLRAGKALSPETIAFAKKNKGFFTSEWKRTKSGSLGFGTLNESSNFSLISLTNIIIGLSLILVLLSMQ